MAEDEKLSTNVTVHDAVSLWADPERSYRHQIARSCPRDCRPATRYFFRLELDGDTNKSVARPISHGAPVGQPLGFRFALSGCAKPKLFGGTRPEAYKAIAGMSDLLFFFHLGDFHYENIDDESVVPRLEAYDDTLRREGIGDLFRQLPLAYCWDDHDFLGNNSEGGDPDNEMARRFARDAYDIYVPHYPLASSTEGIYQSFQIGRVLFLLTDSRFAKSPRGGSGTSGKTVLGVNQKAWLKTQLLRGKDLDLIVWASSIPWIGAEDAGEDYWAGYATERAELCQHLVDNDIRNVCMISADAHMVAIDDGQSWRIRGRRTRWVSLCFRPPHSRARSRRRAGPTRWAMKQGTTGPGIAGNRQFGVFEIDYSGGSEPHVKWTAFRAEKGSTAVTPLLRHEFPARRTFEHF